MKEQTIGIAIFLGLAFVVATIFLGAATGMIGDGQDNIITYTKKVEHY
ncbi:hypothetical protein [Paenibacillus odorifer]|nr:hypothetical protein [Paenibacillus odorifer]